MSYCPRNLPAFLDCCSLFLDFKYRKLLIILLSPWHHIIGLHKLLSWPVSLICYLSIYLSPIYLSICPSVHPSIILSIYLSIYLSSIYRSVHCLLWGTNLFLLAKPNSFFLSIYLSICLSSYLYVCVHICMCMYMNIHVCIFFLFVLTSCYNNACIIVGTQIYVILPMLVYQQIHLSTLHVGSISRILKNFSDSPHSL